MREADNKEMADYILGNLSEADEARLEAEYLADQRLQEQLLFVEDELVDAYVHGRLSTADRALLEARFLASTRGRQKLEFVNSLVRLAGQEPSQDKRHLQPNEQPTQAPLGKSVFARAFPIRRILAVAAALIFALAVGWSLRERLLHQSQPTRGSAPATGSPSRTPEQPLQVSVRLTPTSRGVDHVQRANIPPGAQKVNIQIDVGPVLHDSYRVELMNALDQLKWSGSGFKPRSIPSGNVIDLDLPASLFEPGEYTLLLSPNASGARPIAEYVFVIEKR